MSNRRRMIMGGGGITLYTVGTAELHWNFKLPTALTDTPDHNTIDTTGGVNTFTRGIDLTGKGRHALVANKTVAPRVNGTYAQFLGAHYFERIFLGNVAAGTFYIVLDAGTVTAASAFNPIGSVATIDNTGTQQGVLWLGSGAGTVAGETVTMNTNNTQAAAALYISNNLSGKTVIGVTPKIALDGSAIISLNGAAGNKIAIPSEVAASAPFMDVLIGRRTQPATNYFTGNIEQVLYYSDRHDAEKHALIYSLLTA